MDRDLQRLLHFVLLAGAGSLDTRNPCADCGSDPGVSCVVGVTLGGQKLYGKPHPGRESADPVMAQTLRDMARAALGR